jgi:hypothetical protein
MRRTIGGFEGSLPENEVQLKAVILELSIPDHFAAWRDATWLINDIGQRQTNSHVGILPELKNQAGTQLTLQDHQSSNHRDFHISSNWSQIPH